jgi:hypothetical protein
MPLIYVALVDEGVDVWGPVEATHLEADRFRIVAATPPDERWQFASGQIAQCEPKTLSDGVCIVAVEALAD